jgi:hypothetical protein
MKTFKEFLKEDTQDHRIQLRGHCPICGSVQAVTRGTMAKHGYTVQDGWFQGACPGDRFGSLETDRKPTDDMNISILKDVEGLRERLAKVQTGQIHPEKVRKSDRMIDRNVFIPWEEADQYQQEKARKVLEWNISGRIKAGQQHVQAMSALAEKVHGQDHQEHKISKLPKPSIQVGDLVKVSGKEVTVSRIDIARAEGVGPSLNGQYIDHVFWVGSNGNTYKYPKKLARLVSKQV